MSDDSDVNRSSNPRSENEPRRADRSPEAASDRNRGAAASGDASTYTRDDWEAVPSDPDPSEDLGYEMCDWERINTKDGSEQVMFLPDDEERLRDEAFVVATQDYLVQLSDRC